MDTKDTKFISFLHELMRKHNKLPSQLAADLGVSHVTMIRWLNGRDKPNPKSCARLAKYSGVSPESVFALLDYLPEITRPSSEWPEFREYASLKYPNELDEDMITMIEDLIERRRTKKNGTTGSNLGK